MYSQYITLKFYYNGKEYISKMHPRGRIAVSYWISNYFECYHIATYWRNRIGKFLILEILINSNIYSIQTFLNSHFLRSQDPNLILYTHEETDTEGLNGSMICPNHTTNYTKDDDMRPITYITILRVSQLSVP